MMEDENVKTSATTGMGATETATSAVAKKAWWKSKVLWVGAVGLGSAVASAVFGHELDADTQSAIANLMTSIMSAF